MEIAAQFGRLLLYHTELVNIGCDCFVWVYGRLQAAI